MECSWWCKIWPELRGQRNCGYITILQVWRAGFGVDFRCLETEMSGTVKGFDWFHRLGYRRYEEAGATTRMVVNFPTVHGESLKSRNKPRGFSDLCLASSDSFKAMLHLQLLRLSTTAVVKSLPYAW